jgi:demethylmenaquinone methyltransferase/2-methoxy-6-polyprenyl-1,4-benzoquinol methylase
MRKESIATPTKKIGFIRKVFSEVPATYELINHILTLGFDIIWRRQAAKIAARANEGNWVDMCSGTGEMAVNLNRHARKSTTVHAVDFSLPMLTEAKRKPGAQGIRFLVSDVKHLPFPDGSFNLITISFATRNLNLSREVLVQTFSEFYRILKPEGIFVNLETSRPSSSFLNVCYDLYIKLLVKAVGSRISGSRSAYAYLASTIPRFYPPAELADIMRNAGFDRVTFKRRLFGVAAIHQGEKL